MSKFPKGPLALSLLIIVVGVGWLLTAQHYLDIDWVWTLALGAVGILTFSLSGFDKLSIVVGPFFIAASILSILRQTDRLGPDIEAPILVIIVGALFFVALLPVIPPPTW